MGLTNCDRVRGLRTQTDYHAGTEEKREFFIRQLAIFEHFVSGGNPCANVLDTLMVGEDGKLMTDDKIINPELDGTIIWPKVL